MDGSGQPLNIFHVLDAQIGDEHPGRDMRNGVAGAGLLDDVLRGHAAGPNTGVSPGKYTDLAQRLERPIEIDADGRRITHMHRRPVQGRKAAAQVHGRRRMRPREGDA